jgi:hypothetical protein
MENYDIKGVYKIYQEGKLVAEAENALTETGKEIFIRYLVGGRKNYFVNSISCGISDVANTKSGTLITNKSLGFEVADGNTIPPIYDPDTSGNDFIKFSTVVSGPSEFSIRELGLYARPARSTERNSEIIFTFDKIDKFIKEGTATSSQLIENNVNIRIGENIFSLTPSDATTNYVEQSFGGLLDVNPFENIADYTSQDIFVLAVYNQVATTSSLNIRFFTDENNYYTITFPITATIGYQFSEVKKGTAVKVGSPVWENTKSIRMWHNSSSNLLLDAVKLTNLPEDLDRVSGLVSRAVLASPVKKRPGKPLTIEYYLTLGFNRGI